MKKSKALTALRKARRELERELAGLVLDTARRILLVAQIDREIAILETVRRQRSR